MQLETLNSQYAFPEVQGHLLYQMLPVQEHWLLGGPSNSPVLSVILDSNKGCHRQGAPWAVAVVCGTCGLMTEHNPRLRKSAQEFEGSAHPQEPDRQQHTQTPETSK